VDHSETSVIATKPGSFEHSTSGNRTQRIRYTTVNTPDQRASTIRFMQTNPPTDATQTGFQSPINHAYYLPEFVYMVGVISHPSHKRLRSANRRQLMVPRHRCSTFGRRAFSVAGPMEWNSLPHSLRDPARSTDSFRSAWKTHLFVAERHD